MAIEDGDPEDALDIIMTFCDRLRHNRPDLFNHSLNASSIGGAVLDVPAISDYMQREAIVAQILEHEMRRGVLDEHSIVEDKTD